MWIFHSNVAPDKVYICLFNMFIISSSRRQQFMNFYRCWLLLEEVDRTGVKEGGRRHAEVVVWGGGLRECHLD